MKGLQIHRKYLLYRLNYKTDKKDLSKRNGSFSSQTIRENIKRALYRHKANRSKRVLGFWFCQLVSGRKAVQHDGYETTRVVYLVNWWKNCVFVTYVLRRHKWWKRSILLVFYTKAIPSSNSTFHIFSVFKME